MSELSLLGGFTFSVAGVPDGEIPSGSQRLLTFLAVLDRVATGQEVAGALWPELTGEAASDHLRSALIRLDSRTRQAVRVTPVGLELAGAVVVDLRTSLSLARRLVDRNAVPDEPDISPHAVAALSDDLLPGWYDDWVLLAAEGWRQLRLHALEAAAVRLSAGGRYAEAAVAAQTAVHTEPLRESARAALIRVHVAEGNQGVALSEFERYRLLLHAELGLEPTSRLWGLVAGFEGG